MELALSLGNPSKLSSKDLGFCMGLSSSQDKGDAVDGDEKRVSSDPPLHLHLPPFSPVQGPERRFEMNRLAAAAEEGAVSSFQMAFRVKNRSRRGKRELELEIVENTRGSDDDESGSTRKKLRLSKQQSAFLEESFKEHNTLNPKQKLALAKQLNLRPRQIEVWFQNRRARTKLKQTEIDCEYLKRCCDTLAEKNKRLQKEVQELRALKSCQPFYKQLPATTLTMCPSCERVATAASGSSNTDVKTGEFPFFSLTNA
ncbi:homeobox from Arabidopsis thaliana [Hibiscus trionum]|uniref:Homeobox from Arabidopsis thaliana n=1 Tax=Hibiscus trionum TaxID=183268 RepID=A0A9W7LV49_HIBTR|nr:homeobox from Arabidopsis thaliana [Hibiscus trionum]